MDAKVLPERLTKAAALLSRIAPQRSALPICANLLLQTDNGWLSLTATDLELDATIRVGAQVQKDGAVCLPAKQLAKLSAKLTDDATTIHADGTHRHATLTQEGRTLTLYGLDPDDFPPTLTVPPPSETEDVLDYLDLRRALDRVAVCAAKDDSRPALSGVLIVGDSKAGTLTLTATDGFGLASWQLRYDGGDLQTLVPAGALAKALKLHGTEQDRDLGIAVTNTNLHLCGGTIDTAIHAINATFPRYQDFVPASHETSVTVLKDDLLREADMASTICSHTTKPIIRLAQSQHGRLVASCKSEEEADYEANIEIAEREGDDTNRIALNARQLHNMLTRLDGPGVTLEWQTPDRALVLRDTGDTDGLYVLMPMAVQW